MAKITAYPTVTAPLTSADMFVLARAGANYKVPASTIGGVLAETATNRIFSVTSPGGTSAFVGTIATLPGGANLTYNVTSGNEGAMVPSATTQLGKMVLRNTTRGTTALISNCVTGTNTITLTANVPAGWVVGDTINIASATVSGGGFDWVDIQVTSGPTGKSALFLDLQITSATPGDAMRLHPIMALSSVRYIPQVAQVANLAMNRLGLMQMVSDTFALAWTGTPTSVVISEAGYTP